MNQIRLGLVSLIAFVLLLSLSPVQSQEQGTTTSQSQSSKDSVELTGRRGGGQTAADLMAKARDEGTVRIIVGLRVAFQPEGKLNQPAAVRAQRGAIAQAQTTLLNRLTGVRVTGVKRLAFIPFLAMEVDAAGLEQLRNLPEVATIEEDAFQPASLAESVPLVGAPAAWASGFSGTGQAVAILDTGVDKTHPFLTGKVVSEACYSTTGTGTTSVCPGGVAQSTATGSGVNCTAGGCEHGTHVAGIAAGKSASFSGVGRDANIIAIQVFTRINGCTGSNCVGAFNSDILLGLQRVQTLSSSMSIAAANLSLGGGAFTENCDASQAAFKTAIDNLRSMGIATTVASGNDGNTSGMASPACVSSAISVGSTGDGSNNTMLNGVSSFSNSVSYLNLFAPGAAINSSVPGGGFSIFGGTSMSAPHVAGAWAVLKSKSPNASVSQVLAALSSTGVPVTDTRNGLTKPRIKVDAAVNALSANSCSFSLSPATQAFDLGGGTGMVNVTASAGCAWTALSNDPWITVTAGGSGTGNGTVNYSVGANTALARAGTIFIAGQTFIVTQAGVPVLAIDDGSQENALGLTSGGTVTAVNRLAPSGYPATINAVAIYFPAGSGVSAGNAVTILAGPNSSGSSSINGIQLNETPATVQAVGRFNIYSIPAVTITAGDFVVGMRFTHSAGTLPAAIDLNPPLRRRSYVSTNNGATFTIIDDISASLAGNFMIRALPTMTITCPAPGSLNPSSGLIGSTVTMMGVGFTGVTGVKFSNNVPANFTVNSDTQITVTVPGGARTGPLTISKANCADSRTNTFTVTAPVITGEVVIAGENCSPVNGAIDPGEIVIVSIPLRNTGNLDTGNLVATLQATGGVSSPSAPQTYGILTAGGNAVTKTFTFTGNGNCGSALTATLSLQDGTTNLGTITFSFTLGLKVAFSENFDGVTAPARPAGWTSTVATGTAPPWVTSTISSDTAPNNAFVTDPSTVSDVRLDSPSIAITTASAQLSFRNNYDTEFGASSGSGFDGGVLEIAIGSGSFTDILAAGGSFSTGGYNRTIASIFNNPLAGRQAWSGNSGGYITTTVNLPAAAAGQTIKLRWRMGSDGSFGAPGWRIDTIRLTDGSVCSTICTGLPPCPTIALAPATLPAGTFNVAYAQTLTASGGASPYSFMLSAGVLPNGLTLSSAGVLSGTPTQGGTFPITVKATDASGCMGTQVYMLVINCPTITLSPVTLPNGTFGAAYNQTVTASGGAAPYSFALSTGTLPTGLTLASTGALTGTPAQGGTFNITIRATDANGCTGTRSYSLVIACPTVTLSPATLPGGTVGTAYNQTISASPAGTYNFTVTTGLLPTGLSLNSATGAITGTPTSATTASFTITATLSGGCTGSQAYSLAVQPDGCPTVTGLSPGNGPIGTPVTITGAGFAGVTAVRFTNNVTAQFTATATQITTTVPAGAATGAITILKTGCPDVRTGTFTVGNPPPVITSIEPAAVAVGGPSFLLTVRGTGFINGSQVRWNNGGRFTTFVSATELRATIFSSDIENEGENLVTVVNPGGGTSNAVTLMVKPPNLPPVLTSITPTVATAGGQNFMLTVTGSNFVNGSMVRWNNANRTTGFVSNTQLTAMIPATDIATAGTASITVFTPELGGGTSAVRTFTINQACPTVSGLNPASGLVGTLVTINGANLTGVTAVRFSNNVTAQFTAGSATQITTTVPAGAVTGPITISKTGCPDVQTSTFTVITCPALTINPATLPDGPGGTAYSQTLTASGGTAPYSFAVTAGALPNGLTLSTGGVLSGIPNVAGTFNFTVTATDANGCTGTRSYTVNITVTLGAQTRALYVLRNSTSGNQIYGYAVNETTGALTLLSGFPILTGGNGNDFSGQEQLTIDRANQRLYAINRGSNTVSAYAINPATGALTAPLFSPISLGSGEWLTLAVHPSGSPLIVGDANGRLLSYQITATTVTGAAGSPYSTGSARPRSIAFSQDSNYVYTGGGSSANFIGGFNVNAANGVLTDLTGSPFDSGNGSPGAYATDVVGRLFVANLLANQVRVFTTASGIPSAVSGNPFASGLFEAVHGLLHPNGFYLVTDRSNDRVGVYRISGSGSATTLIAVPGSPFAAGGSLTDVLALNQAGTFLFAANETSRNLTTFSVNPATGALTLLGTQPANTLGSSGNPTGMAYLAQPCSTITLSPTTLPGSTVGTAYNQTVTASPSDSYNFSVTTGALPAGLSLNAATGAITGTPTAAGTANFTITALSFGPCSGSQAYSITVIQPNPPPVLTSLEPNARVVGSSGFTLALNGSGFIPASQVKWNGADRQTSFVNNTRLTIDVPASDLAAVGTASLTVVNPMPGGGASNALSFTISSPAYEADVAPRPDGTGDGTVSLADYVMIGRFAAGLDTAAVGSEFQRADCAPRESLGDGQITLTDYVQAGLYAVGLNPVVPAGGPTSPPATAQALAHLLQSSSAGKASAVDARRVRALDSDLESGRSNSLAVELEATGQENALAFSLRFDAGRWRILAVKPGRDAERANLQTNLRQQNIGRVGLTLTLPPGQTLTAGRREVVTVIFAPLHTALAEPISLGFSDEPIAREVVDAWANALPATFTTETARPAIGALTNVSAASMSGAELSPGAIAAAFGINLATATQSADMLPLPASLAGTLVNVTDSAGVERLASLFFVSAGQVNYQVPPDTAPGLAIVTITSGDGAISTGMVEIAESSPGLFTANADGQGVAAAVALRVKADGSQQFEPVAVFDPVQQRFIAAPIDVGSDGEQVFLILHGTGLRTRGDLSKVTATIGGERAEVLYAGAQGGFAGLDQINLRLPRELAGRGEVELVLKANGKAANAVRVAIK